jgi:hypothetical protein
VEIYTLVWNGLEKCDGVKLVDEDPNSPLLKSISPVTKNVLVKQQKK